MIFHGSALSFNGRELEALFALYSPSSDLEGKDFAWSASLRSNSCHDFLGMETTSRNNYSPLSPMRTNQRHHQAALRLQKVYKSFRTRRQLADCAVLAEQRWWKLLDFAELKRSSISFFDIEKPETAISRWSRARTRAAKVGKGLSKDEKARKLALQHWLEAIDPRHRYGHNLQFYYARWLHCDSKQPFFYWLDIGEGKETNLDWCARSKLQQQCIKYLGTEERKAYEVSVEDGEFLYRQSGKLLDTREGPPDAKWIFVLSTSKILYVGQKSKGTFQHSSFLAGGATLAAGRLFVEEGILKAVWPHSGHYLPTEENFQELMSFLEEHKVDLSNVKKCPTEEEEATLFKRVNNTISSCSSEENLTRRMDEPNTEKSAQGKDDLRKQNQNADESSDQTASTWSRRRGIRLGSLITRLEIPGRADRLYMFRKDLGTQPPNCESPGEDGYETAEEYFLEQEFMVSKPNLFDDKNDKDLIPKEKIMKRIDSHKGMKSYQLAQQLSSRWTTGAGPRIGCMRDYPTELQVQVLEQANLSPRGTARTSAPRANSRFGSMASLTSISSCRESNNGGSPLTPDRLVLFQTATP
ncbi:IQ domain-containing protein IQM6-like [Punica granatum]|uniref:IQ domain-containing protein IQM6-like n=1 Tax=Punica granatum TaxID=22663 RepID=A0A6P8DWK3_PUNGR|nr:IQ domain-containing protein IQM6-like [Punica granatum]